MINSSSLIKKELCYWDKNYDGVEDYDMWLRLWKNCKKFFNVPEFLVLHRIHNTSAFNSKGNNLKVNDLLNRNIIQTDLSKEKYLEKIKSIKEHIQQGDIYEANFCYEYHAQNIQIEPLGIYQKLNERTQAPFSVFGKINHRYIISASPERFIKKEDNKVISQPIKGTIKRGKDEQEDLEMIQFLENNPKDRSENIMIVDLVRNDLSKIANPASVVVEELCKIYTFKNIHQMISTVSAKIENVTSIDIIKALFPMGSMTGAPKIRAMELMEHFEENKRGLYSGAIGYFAPNGDFDFNVAIRTLLYDEIQKTISFSVGGAITDLSLPEQEYEETLLKAEAIIKALTK
jgi:para-aminobenzoate synthetase component 1